MLESTMSTLCPLCETQNELFYQNENSYYKCSTCDAIYADENDKPDTEAERERYELHDSDTEDVGYRKFVSPITDSIQNDFTTEDNGLDFGAGTSAIISAILKENNYNIKNYDPYFHIYPELLKDKYDYISSCEVIEHFYNPYKEFELLTNLLKENGKLYLMTEPHTKGTNFAKWYYKNDPTHVFFYSENTFEWIKQTFGFSSVMINGRLIIFEK